VQPAVLLPLIIRRMGGLRGGASDPPVMTEDNIMEMSEHLKKIQQFLFKSGEHLADVGLELACP